MISKEEATNPRLLIDQISGQFIQVFLDHGVQFLRLETAHWAEAERRKRESLRPFKKRNGSKEQNDFNDALILCAVATASESGRCCQR